MAPRENVFGAFSRAMQLPESLQKRKVVLVCGGRDFRDAKLVARVLAAAEPKHIVHGACRGADALAGRWAKAQGGAVRVTAVAANWGRHGKAAGPRRNAEMLKLDPDYVLAFDGGRGTRDMVAQATRRGVPVFLVSKTGTVQDAAAIPRKRWWLPRRPSVGLS